MVFVTMIFVPTAFVTMGVVVMAVVALFKYNRNPPEKTPGQSPIFSRIKNRTETLLCTQSP